MTITDARIDIKRARVGLKHSKVISITAEGQAERTVKGNAHLTAVRVTSEDQIKFLSVKPVDPRRIMHEQDVFGLGIGWRQRRRAVALGQTNKIDFTATNFFLLVQQPRAAASRKALFDRLEGDPALKVVITRDAEHRRLDASQDFQCFGKKFSLLDDVASEANKVR